MVGNERPASIDRRPARDCRVGLPVLDDRRPFPGVNKILTISGCQEYVDIMADVRTPRKRFIPAGLVFVLIGFVTLAVSSAIDGGFWRGFFQGATISLMVVGAFVIGRSVWPSGRSTDDDATHWLPSRDGDHR